MPLNPGVTKEQLESVVRTIDSEYSGIKAELRLFGGMHWTSHLKAIEGTVDTFVSDLIASVTEGDRSKLVELLRKRRSTLSLSSGIRTEIVGICKQILAFGAAGFALSLGFSDKFRSAIPPVQKAIVIGGVFYLELMIVSLVVMVLYMLQARFRYPFIYFDRIGNTWPAFYYASISADISRSPVQTSKQRLKAATRYAQDFVRFSWKVVEETDKEQLRVELQQYYLLVAYQAYTHQFSLRLANAFFYGFVGAFLTLVVLVVWSILQ